MASFRCFRMMLSLPVLAAAETYLTSTHAQLEANVTLQTNGSWHLGGFCLGQAGPDEMKAAELTAHVEWEGTQKLGETGPVMLLAFDAREHRWGAVKDSWGQLSCEEKLSAANMKRQLGKTHNLEDFFFRIEVHQKTAIRDWHFALLTCGETEQAQLSLRVVAIKGALSMFESNTHFHTSSCPVVDVPWLQAAHDEVGFWLLLVGAVLFGCSAVLAVVACRNFRKKADLDRCREIAAARGASPVVGRPCSQIGEAKVVDGQTNKDMATERDEAAALDSCV